MRAMYSLLNEEIVDGIHKHIFYGFLPLAHSLEMCAELVFFGAGLRIGYASPYTMTDNGTAITKGQKGDLRLLKPTVLAGVPLILDRIRKTLTDRFEGKHLFWKQLFKYCTAYKNFWVNYGYDTPLVNHFICRRVQGQLGGRVSMLACFLSFFYLFCNFSGGILPDWWCTAQSRHANYYACLSQCKTVDCK